MAKVFKCVVCFFLYLFYVTLHALIMNTTAVFWLFLKTVICRDMLEVDLLVDHCLHQTQEEECTLLVLQHPDPVDPQMHQYPQVVLPDSHLCHLGVQDILVHMEDLPDPDQCIQVNNIFKWGMVFIMVQH